MRCVDFRIFYTTFPLTIPLIKRIALFPLLPLLLPSVVWPSSTDRLSPCDDTMQCYSRYKPDT